jgi:hypothetical protein
MRRSGPQLLLFLLVLAVIATLACGSPTSPTPRVLQAVNVTSSAGNRHSNVDVFSGIDHLEIDG